MAQSLPRPGSSANRKVCGRTVADVQLARDRARGALLSRRPAPLTCVDPSPRAAASAWHSTRSRSSSASSRGPVLAAVLDAARSRESACARSAAEQSSTSRSSPLGDPPPRAGRHQKFDSSGGRRHGLPFVSRSKHTKGIPYGLRDPESFEVGLQVSRSLHPKVPSKGPVRGVAEASRYSVQK